LTKEDRVLLEQAGANLSNDFETIDARLHGKAVATKAGLIACKKYNDDCLLHIDSDAWLLSNVKNETDKMPANTLLAFNDRKAGAINKQTIIDLFGKEYEQIPLNAGIVFYKLGKNIESLIDEFEESVFDEWRQTKCGNQPILRILAEKHRQLGANIILHPDAQHWNPIWGQAEKLTEKKQNVWINEATGNRQRIFHATGGKRRRKGKEKPWQNPKNWTSSILECYQKISGIKLRSDGSGMA
jgi:hypothetical protein